MNHASTPWTYKAGEILSGPIVIAEIKLPTTETVEGRDFDLEDAADTNAAFIVRAVNCHEDLIDVVRRFIGTPYSRENYRYFEKEFKQAIAKAEKGNGE